MSIGQLLADTVGWEFYTEWDRALAAVVIDLASIRAETLRGSESRVKEAWHGLWLSAEALLEFEKSARPFWQPPSLESMGRGEEKAARDAALAYAKTHTDEHILSHTHEECSALTLAALRACREASVVAFDFINDLDGRRRNP